MNIKMTLVSRERRMMFDEYNGVHAGMHAMFWGMHGRRCVRGNTSTGRFQKSTLF